MCVCVYLQAQTHTYRYVYRGSYVKLSRGSSVELTFSQQKAIDSLSLRNSSMEEMIL